MISKFILLVTVLALCLMVVQGSPIKIPSAPTTRSTANDKATRNDRLSNAQRIARGLPLRTPERLYDPTRVNPLKARAS
ncbi:hypothetical protein I204_04681 [Kwoniella mangroviensis CBS 8886]|uniref:uncharacterized protein n=1 Tax=Kwoniella mangroviensis CBS 8507 TaxID=1296122 RepID=UPI00080D1E64|nr:uncharacterized protein I203_04118 [Kwoniella mangroviensis CBS 8507]OCF66542.1 hypothetical protein I203_04118 [Kwoniella mangroviensis CBS 8507]OCF74310.1 hypothetical protein I204_04681 [Kwoniella mangroviensis CBS 8886]